MAARIELAKRQSTNVCATTAVYKSPQAGSVVDSSQQVTFGWDTNCNPAPAAIDIYLFAPALNPPKIQVWYGVKFSTGSYPTYLKPAWWKSAPEVDLQYAFVESDTPSFMSTIPPGPSFSATYNATGATTAPSDGSSNPGLTPVTDSTNSQGFTTVDNYTGGGLSKGGLAAAILLPLIFVGAALAAYIVYSRRQEAKRRKRWSHAVDRRMSAISNDWRSITAAGVAARSSVAANRMSAFGGRPTSSLVGATREMQGVPHARPPTFASGDRVSRVSFAADSLLNRQSVHDRKGHNAGRSLPYGSGDAPTLPSKKSVRGDDLTIAPDQARGAVSLSQADIKHRALASGSGDNLGAPNEGGDRSSYFDAGLANDAFMLPAITLMRTGGTANELLLAPQPATPPASKTAFVMPASPPKMPVSPLGPMPLMQVPTEGMDMSPDAMMRHYAQLRYVAAVSGSPYSSSASAEHSPSFPASPGTGVSYPAIAHVTAAGTGSMRTLYSPGTPYASVPQSPLTPPTMGSNNPFRHSVAPSVMSSMYSATEAQHDIGTAE